MVDAEVPVGDVGTVVGGVVVSVPVPVGGGEAVDPVLEPRVPAADAWSDELCGSGEPADTWRAPFAAVVRPPARCSAARRWGRVARARAGEEVRLDRWAVGVSPGSVAWLDIRPSPWRVDAACVGWCCAELRRGGLLPEPHRVPITAMATSGTATAATPS